MTVKAMQDIQPGDVLHQYQPMSMLTEPKDLKVVSVHLYERSVELVLEDGNVLKGYRGMLSSLVVKT